MKFKIIIVISILLVLGLVGHSINFYITPLGKVVDPTNPKFELSRFHFADYCNKTQLYAALAALISEGMKKEDVDYILVELGHARANEIKSDLKYFQGKIFYDYKYNIPLYKFVADNLPIPRPPENWPSHFVRVEYTTDMRVKSFRVLSAISWSCKTFE